MADIIYVESGYWPQGYVAYTANADLSPAFNAQLSCDAEVIPAVTGETVNGSGSWTSNFVLSSSVNKFAELNSVINSSVSLEGVANRIVSVNSSLSSTVNLSASISHIEGADLSAFANANLSVTALIIKTSSVEVNSTTNLSASANVSKAVSAGITASSTLTAQLTRLIISDEILFDGWIENGWIDLGYYYGSGGSISYLTATADKVIVASANFASQAQLSATISHIEGADILAENFASLTADNRRVRFASATINSQSELAVESTEFSGVGAGLVSQFTVSISAGKIEQLASALTASSSVSASAGKIQQLQSQPSSAFSSTAVVRKLSGLASQTSAAFTQTTSAQRTVDAVAEFGDRYIDDGWIDISYYEGGGAAFATVYADLTERIGILQQAEALLSVTSQATATAQRLVGLSSTMVVTTAVQAMVSHVEGADLFAFSQAQLAIQVSLIRNNNISATAAFNVATDAVRTIFVAAQADSQSTVAIANQRVRYQEAAVSAALSLAVTPTKIQQSSSSLSSSAGLVTDARRVISLASASASTTVLTCAFEIVDVASANLTAQTSLTASAKRFRGITATPSSTFTIPTVVVDQSSLILFYNANNVDSARIYSSGSNLHSTFVDTGTPPTGGYHSIWTNFWFKTGQIPSLNSSLAIYTSGNDTAFNNYRCFISFRRETNGSYNFLIRNVVEHVPGANLSLPGDDGLYNIRITTYNTTISLGTNFDPLAWHNIHVPMVIGRSMTRPTESSWGDLWASSVDNIRIDGQAKTVTTTSTFSSQPRGSFTYPTLLVPASGGYWGAGTNDVDLYLDNIWVKTTATGNNRDSYVDFPVSDFYQNSTPLTSTGVTPSGTQPNVYLPFNKSSRLQDANILSPTWNYVVDGGRVLVGIAKGFDIDVTAQFTQTTNPLRIIKLGSDMQTTTAQTVTGLRIKSSAVSMSAQTAQTATPIKIVQSSVVLASQSQLTVTYRRFRTGSSTQASQFTQATFAVKTARTTSTQSAQTEQISNLERIRFADSSISVSTVFTADAVKIARAGIQTDAIATALTAAAKVGQGLIHSDVVSTMDVSARLIADQPQFLPTSSNMTVIGSNTLFGSADLALETGMAISGDYLRRNESTQSAETSLELTVSKITGYSSTLAAQTFAQIYTEESRIRGFTSNLACNTNIITNNQIVRLASADLVSNTEQVTLAGVVVRYEADLVVNGFILSAGRILHIDPYNQLQILPESRIYLIEQESRLLTINSETRVNIIEGN